jgi:rRNA maturation endonuclease Nob1
MRSTKAPSIGQGCRAMRFGLKVDGPRIDGRCAIHREYFVNRCMGCGDLFHSKAPHTKTCGDRCRKRLSRMRHSKMFQMVMAIANGE